MNTLKPSELLACAIKRLSRRGAWAQKDLAYDRLGDSVPPTDPAARCWCSIGAVYACADYGGGGRTPDSVNHALVFFEQTLKGWSASMAEWNDEYGRKKATVLKHFAQAAELARSEGQ